MTSGQALVQLIRMRDMKVKRLAEYDPRKDSNFLRADIGALNYAIGVMEGLQADGRLVDYRSVSR